MWTLYLPRILLAFAFGCWCFHLSQACTTTSRCSVICEYSDWAKHAACGRRYLEDIPQVCCGVKSLDLRQNNVQTLRKGALKTFTNLKYIYLDRNNMSVVRKGAFQGCSKLEHLSMGENNFRGLTRRMLEGLEKVKYLIISRGKLKRIDRGTFLETPSLLTLDLQGNQLVSPPCEALPAGNIVKTLFLSRNHISVIPRLCFQNFTELKRLHLNDNPIGDITNINVFQGLESLEELSLKNISISVVPVALFRDINTMTTLIMSQNLIESLHERDFMGLPYLTTLNLESNRIVTIHEKAFSGLDFLQFLVLSNNRILSIGQGALRPVEGTLHDLHLHGNILSEIQNISSSFASLERIFIADNPLICTCQLAPLRQWLQLNRDVLSSTEGNAKCTIPDTNQNTPILESNLTYPCLQTTPGTILLPEEERSTVDFEASTYGSFPNSTRNVPGLDLPRMFLVISSTIFVVLVIFMVFLLIICFKARRRTNVEKDRESDSIYATVDDNSVEEIPPRLYNLRISYNPVYSTRIRHQNNRTCSTSCSLCNGSRGLSSLSPSPPSPHSQRNPPVPSGSCRNVGHTNVDVPTHQRLAIAYHSQCGHGTDESRNIWAESGFNADNDEYLIKNDVFVSSNEVTAESKCPNQVSFSVDSGNNGINARKNVRSGEDGFTPEGENSADGVDDGGYLVAKTSFQVPLFDHSRGLSHDDAINNSPEEILAGPVNTIWTRVSTKRSLKSDHRNYLQQVMLFQYFCFICYPLTEVFHFTRSSYITSICIVNII